MLIKNNQIEEVIPPVHPVVAGKIGRAYGVSGWIKVFSFTEKIDDIFYYTPWFVCEKFKWRKMQLIQWRTMKNCYVAKIKGVLDRESAKFLTNTMIIVDAIHFPILQDHEYYWKDLIGCVVITITGVLLGKIISIINTPVHDVLVVKKSEQGKTDSVKQKDCLIPFILNRIINNVNFNTRVVTVDWDIDF